LHQYMVQIQGYVAEISRKITQTYFQGALKHAA
jgi:hypothetical protein